MRMRVHELSELNEFHWTFFCSRIKRIKRITLDFFSQLFKTIKDKFVDFCNVNIIKVGKSAHFYLI